MRAIGRVGLILLAVVAAGCGWMQTGYDAGHSNANKFENHVTVANVASLEDHVVPVEMPDWDAVRSLITSNGRLIVTDSSTASAFDTSTCPRADGSPCPVVWRFPVLAQSAIASDGQRVFVTSTSGGLDVRSLTDGAMLGHVAAGATHITISDATVFTTDSQVVELPWSGIGPHHYAEYNSLSSFPAECDLAQCPVTPLGSWGSQVPLAGFPNPGPDVTAFDGRPYKVRIRDGIGVGSGATGSTVGTRELSDPACEQPVPDCTPLATYTGLNAVSAISPDHVFSAFQSSLVTTPPSWELQWFPGVHADCPGAPAQCSLQSRAALGPTYVANVAVGGNVVYVGTSSGLQAFAEDGTTGCTSASPRVCSAVATFPFGTSATAIAVVDRRVYVGTSGAVHVLTIPGDVS